MFGRESKGLDNASLKLCDWVTTIPVSPEQPSINLAQAVMVFAFSLFDLTTSLPRPAPKRGHRKAAAENLAFTPDFLTNESVREVLDRLDEALDALGYGEQSDKKPRIRAVFHRLFKRTGLMESEAQMFRGLSRRIVDEMSKVKSENERGQTPWGLTPVCISRFTRYICRWLSPPCFCRIGHLMEGSIMEEAELKAELLKCIQEKAVIRGLRKLASGKESNFYIDGKQVTLDAKGLFLTAKVIYGMVHSVHADAIGGPTLGADPIAAAVALLSSQSGHPLKAFLVRKAAKDHGIEKLIEGPALHEGDRVVMVEDVITTGQSVLRAIQEVEKTKAKVVKVICLVDRNEGATEALAAYQYTPIFTLRDLRIS